MSARSRCGAVRILAVASPMNPLQGSGVSERSPCGAVRILELADGIRTAPQRSAPTRPIPVEGSSGHGRMGTAPQRERSDTPESLWKVHRRAQGFARHHSESAPTRPIPVEGSSGHGRMGTAPQRKRSDTPDPCRRFIGELKDSHGTTARARRHARSL